MAVPPGFAAGSPGLTGGDCCGATGINWNVGGAAPVCSFGGRSISIGRLSTGGLTGRARGASIPPMGDDYAEATYGDRIAEVYDERAPKDAEAAVAFLRDLAGEGPALELGIAGFPQLIADVHAPEIDVASPKLQLHVAG